MKREKGFKIIRWEYRLWVLMLLVVAVMLLYRNTHESLWYDETCTYAAVTHPVGEVWGLIAGDFHPPLYFFMLSLFTKLFGSSVFIIRAFSALGVLATAALGIGPIKKLLGRRAGLIYSYLFCIVPILLVFAQETRMYAWTLFWTTGAVCYGVLGVAEGKKRDWVLYGAFFLGAIYTHFYGLLAMMGMNLIILIWILFNAKHRIAAYLMTVSVVFIGFLPWLANLLGQANRVLEYYWIPPITLDTIWHVLQFPFSLKFFTSAFTLYAFLTAYILIALGIVVARKAPEKEKLMVFASIGTYTLTIGLAIAISLVVRPILVQRYSMAVLGVFLVPIAYGLARIKRKGFMVLGLLLLTGFSLPIRYDIYSQYHNGPTPADYMRFKKELRTDDVIVCMDETTMGVFYYYYSDYELILINNGTALFANQRVFVPTISIYPNLRRVIHTYSGKRIWLAKSLFDIPQSRIPKIEMQGVKKETRRILKSSRGYVAILIYQAEEK